MSGMRELDQADFDLERFIDMFDTALTSNDPRVVETLRKLLMIVALTKPEGPREVEEGPLRRLYDDMHNLNRRLDRVEDELRRAQHARSAREEADPWRSYDHDKYSLQAAQVLAQKIDQDLLNTLKIKAKGLYDK